MDRTWFILAKIQVKPHTVKPYVMGYNYLVEASEVADAFAMAQETLSDKCRRITRQEGGASVSSYIEKFEEV